MNYDNIIDKNITPEGTIYYKKIFLLQILNRQLESLGISGKPQMVSRFVEIYKQIWTLNGDHISMIYAGTGALGGGRSKVRPLNLTD